MEKHACFAAGEQAQALLNFAAHSFTLRPCCAGKTAKIVSVPSGVFMQIRVRFAQRLVRAFY